MKVKVEFKFRGELYVYHLNTDDVDYDGSPIWTWVIILDDGAHFEIDIFHDFDTEDWQYESENQIAGEVYFYPDKEGIWTWQEHILFDVE